jgi:hypothetical protein
MGLSVLEYVDKKHRFLSKNKQYVLLGRLLDSAKCLDIYKISDNKGNHFTVRADDDFFIDFNHKYKYLYNNKEYYVNYITNKKLFFIERNGNNKQRPKHTLSSDISKYILKRDNYECFNCGSKNDLTIDHIHPISKSFDDSAYNKVTMCRKCNGKKSDDEDYSEEILIKLIKREKLKQWV